MLNFTNALNKHIGLQSINAENRDSVTIKVPEQTDIMNKQNHASLPISERKRMSLMKCADKSLKVRLAGQPRAQSNYRCNKSRGNLSPRPVYTHLLNSTKNLDDSQGQISPSNDHCNTNNTALGNLIGDEKLDLVGYGLQPKFKAMNSTPGPDSLSD